MDVAKKCPIDGSEQLQTLLHSRRRFVRSIGQLELGHPGTDLHATMQA